MNNQTKNTKRVTRRTLKDQDEHEYEYESLCILVFSFIVVFILFTLFIGFSYFIFHDMIQRFLTNNATSSDWFMLGLMLG